MDFVQYKAILIFIYKETFMNAFPLNFVRFGENFRWICQFYEEFKFTERTLWDNFLIHYLWRKKYMNIIQFLIGTSFILIVVLYHFQNCRHYLPSNRFCLYHRANSDRNETRRGELSKRKIPSKLCS